MTIRTDHQPTKQPSPNILLKRRVETTASQGPTHRPRLLIVEDHAESGLLMQYALRKDYHTEVAPTAGEALQKAATTTYDGFLIDINLCSQRNGIDVLEALRADGQHRRAPMVAVTAHALPGDRERFLEAGFDDYLSKPFATDDLRAVVRREMKRRPARRAPVIEKVPAES